VAEIVGFQGGRGRQLSLRPEDEKRVLARLDRYRVNSISNLKEPRMEHSAGEAPCPHTTIEPSLDRWTECHWHLHQMESNYHEPDPFRYSLNSFIRSAKEVTGILMTDLQRHPTVRGQIDSELKKLNENLSLRRLRSDAIFWSTERCSPPRVTGG
jgi:hypothetical protein